MSDLSKIIKTKNNAANFLDAMDKLVQKTFTEGFVPNKESLGNLYPLFEDCPLEEIREKVVDYREELEKMNTVNLQMSSMPSKEFFSKLHSLLSANGVDNFLINIDVEEGIGYSYQLSVNGKHIKSDLKDLVLSCLMSKNVI